MPYSVKRDWQHGKPSSLKNSEEIKKFQQTIPIKTGKTENKN